MPQMYPPGVMSSNVRGGNDPVRSAIVSQMRRGEGAPQQQPQATTPQTGPAPAGGGNEVATHLARAFDALLRTGPTDENLAALQGFLTSLQQLGPAGQAPTAPQGQAGPMTPPAGGITPPR